MLRIDGDLDDRAAEKELLRPQPGDYVGYRQLQLLNGKRARIPEAEQRAATPHELLETLQIVAVELIRVLRPRCAASATATSAAGHARDRNSHIVAEDQHVDPVAERRPEVLGTDRERCEAVLFQRPARPPRVHARGPRIEYTDPRLPDRARLERARVGNAFC